MFYILLKVYSTKTGEYVIAPHVTNQPNLKYNPPIIWSRRHFHNLNQQILYFAVDSLDLNNVFYSTVQNCKNDPLFRNFWKPEKPRKKRIFKEESREKYRLAKLGTKWSNELRVRESIRRKLQCKNGRPPVISYHNQDNPAMIEKIKNNPYHTNRPKEKCPHCGGEYGINMIGYRHKDNCKFNW
jgi:hypothetical protein